MTYGRTWLLAEAVEAYIRQDYTGPSELVIVNDFAGMTLAVEAARCKPNQSIRVVNLASRMTSLNDKFDLGVKMAQYPLIAMWDDDDISLGHRLRASVDALEAMWVALGPSYASFTHHYSLNAGQKPTLIDRGIHGGDMFSKDCYTLLNGSQGDGHNDQNFVFIRIRMQRDR